MTVLIKTLTSCSLKLAAMLALASLALSLPISSNAGFMDSLQEAQNSIRSIGRTADSIRGSKRAVEDLSEDVGLTGQPETVIQGATVTTGQVVTGAVLLGKLQQTNLYAQPNKSASPVAILSNQDVMIYMGSEQNGYYYIQSDKGAGWVAKPLVAVQ